MKKKPFANIKAPPWLAKTAMGLIGTAEEMFAEEEKAGAKKGQFVRQALKGAAAAFDIPFVPEGVEKEVEDFLIDLVVDLVFNVLDGNGDVNGPATKKRNERRERKRAERAARRVAKPKPRRRNG